MPGNNDRTVDDYKNILREAITVNEKMTVQGKQKILTFKNTLSDYIEALDEYQGNHEAQGDADEVYEVEKSDNKLELLQNDLKDQAEELLSEIELAKRTFQ